MQYQKTIQLKDGRACLIRNGTAEDGPALLELFLLTHMQTDYLLTYPDEHSLTAEDEAAFLQVMHRMAVRATYIKRSANLILLGEEGAVPVHEVRLALDEMATWLQSCGVAVRVAPIAAGTLPTDDALSALKGFYEAAAEAPAGSCVACRFDGPSLVVHVLTDGGGAA